MNRRRVLTVCSAALVLSTGCALTGIKGKTKFGPSFRHKGSKRTDSVRWTAQQGFDFKWDNGITTGISFRRRDTDNGNGDNANAIFFNVSYPLWKAKKKPDRLKKRVKKLEKRLAEMEARLEESGEK